MYSHSYTEETSRPKRRLGAGYVHTGMEEEDVKRKESWRMGLEGEHQATGWDKRDGTKGNRVWGSEKQKNK